LFTRIGHQARLQFSVEIVNINRGMLASTPGVTACDTERH